MDQTNVDIIIAGAGCTGLLLASRLTHYFDFNILVLEKEPITGGRLRSVSDFTESGGYGLNNISPQLYNFWDQTLKLNPESMDLPYYTSSRQKTVGILSAGNISEFNVIDILSPISAKAIGGAAAVRDWKNVEDIINDHADNKKSFYPIGQLWKSTRKSPSAVVLEHLSNLFGIPDIWLSTPSALKQRAEDCASEKYQGPWVDALNALYDEEKFSLITDCTIIDADYKDGWALETQQGKFKSKILAVCQPPWQALSWLKQSLWPTGLLPFAVKSKPVSTLSLTEQISGDSLNIDLPDIIIVPAEKSQIIKSPSGELCFQASIDFEVSFQAPTVVKTIKRLKRAKKKLLAAYPNLKTKGDHIALLPFGWTQPILSTDKKWMDKLKNFNCAHLIFCGDSYDNSYIGDMNLINSINSAIEYIKNL